MTAAGCENVREQLPSITTAETRVGRTTDTSSDNDSSSDRTEFVGSKRTEQGQAKSNNEVKHASAG
jgi:hypothetical protein